MVKKSLFKTVVMGQECQEYCIWREIKLDSIYKENRGIYRQGAGWGRSAGRKLLRGDIRGGGILAKTDLIGFSLKAGQDDQISQVGRFFLH